MQHCWYAGAHIQMQQVLQWHDVMDICDIPFVYRFVWVRYACNLKHIYVYTQSQNKL